MIKKELKLPLKVKKLQALLRRIPQNHPKRPEIQEELAKRISGYNGEKSLDYYLSFLPTQDYFIVHDLRIPNTNGTHFFQMDILIFSQAFFLIVEVKHISGTLTFDPAFDQVIWTNPTTGKEIALQDPIRQVTHQQYQLLELLKQKGYQGIPVESIVVLTNPSTIIKQISDKNNHMDRVIRSTRLLFKLEQIKKRYKTEVLTQKDLKKIINFLIRSDTPDNPDYLTQYQIQNNQILTGVFCPNCSSHNMEYQRGTWKCPKCFTTSKDAHFQSLKDYVLLVQPLITTPQMKEFLHLPTTSIAYHILHSMNLKHSYPKKGREYHLEFQLEQED